MASKKSSSERAPAVPPVGPLATNIAQKWRRAGTTLTIERIASELGDVPRYDIVAALKELEKAGMGAFTVGQAGQKARFAWTNHASTEPKLRAHKAEAHSGSASKSRAPRASALDSQALRTERANGRPGRDGAVLDHTFHLRPGFVATVSLPIDVTRPEVERFCRFLQAIPFMKPGGASLE